MAMQMPCITTTLANKALMAKENEEILVADEPEKFAEDILMLLSNEEKAGQIALNGYRFVKENFNWHVQSGRLEEVICNSEVREGEKLPEN
jgi:polysaccharide biosynthesis protein PslH